MKFFLSGETSLDDVQFRKFSIIQNEIEKKINEFVFDSDYGSFVQKTIGIIPLIHPITFYALNPKYKERRLMQHKQKSADYRLAIDYDKFINADDEGKKRLLIANIIEVIRDIGKKIKKKEEFDAERLEKDILSVFALQVKDLSL